MKATEVVWSLFESMDEIVDFLQIQLIGDTYNLKINPDDVFTDMVAYYKSNQFDPLQPLKVHWTTSSRHWRGVVAVLHRSVQCIFGKLVCWFWRHKTARIEIQHICF